MFRSKKKPKAPAEDIASEVQASLSPAPTYLLEMSTTTVVSNNSNKNKDQVKLQVDLQALKHGAGRVTLTGADLVGSIDQGTSSTRFLVFTAAGVIAASAQMEHRQIFPDGEDKVGWHEHDPLEIWSNTVTCIQTVVEALQARGISIDEARSTGLAATGITNQRETTIAWNRETGVPYYNAIVWDDTRTVKIAADVADGDMDRLRRQTGLPVASYFAGTKVKWLLDNVPALREDLQDDAQKHNVCFGTVDSWLMFQLTGQKAVVYTGGEAGAKATTPATAANCGGLFVTDVTNASRWLFMDLATQSWDSALIQAVCAPHAVPLSALPEIGPSSHVYGTCSGAACGVPTLAGVPLAAILGDQQAALFGQSAFLPGEAKNTYGTGMFLMMNTGEVAVHSTHGLLTTVAYQIGQGGAVHYALEGSVSHSGSTIQWLRDQLQIIGAAPESETLARTTLHNDGLYFVPAFAGLFAPHWRSDARACIVGMTATHHKGHICRAALEAAAYQAREVFEAIAADSNVNLKTLNVDGGGTNNKLLMQFQADIINVPVVKLAVMETTAIGAAFAAGLAVGVWKDLDEIKSLWAVAETYQPKMASLEREKYWLGWQKAVTRSLGWVDEEESDKFVDALSSQPSPLLNEGDVDAVVKKDSSMAAAGYSTLLLAVCTGAALGAGFLLGRHHRKL